MCAGKDSNLRRINPTGLQPVAIDHSATDAFVFKLKFEPMLVSALLKAIRFTHNAFLQVRTCNQRESKIVYFLSTDAFPSLLWKWVINYHKFFKVESCHSVLKF